MATKPTTKIKAAAPAAADSTFRPHVVSFRLTEAQHSSLLADFEETNATDVSSSKALARKIVVDYLSGRLVYKNPEDRKKNCDTIED